MRRRRRGEKPAVPAIGGRPALINRELILDAALEMGVDNLSMHGLAKKLGVSTTALYRYVDSRDALLNACMDQFCARVKLPDTDLHWREYLIALGLGFRTALQHTPGASAYGVKLGPTTAAAYSIMEQSLGVLIEGGFKPIQAWSAYSQIVDHAFLIVQKEEQYAKLEEENGQFGYRVLQLDKEVLQDFPHIGACLDEVLPPDFGVSYERQLQTIVRGLSPDNDK